MTRKVDEQLASAPMHGSHPLEDAYEDGRARLVGLIAGPGSDPLSAAGMPVPACPGWSVHDVVAHLSGLCVDVLQGNIQGGATDAWTAAQIDARRSIPIGDVLAEWDEVGPKIAGMVDDLPGWYGVQVVADLTVHEQDIRGALGRPGSRSGASIDRATDFLITVVVEAGANAAGVGPLEIKTPARSWTVGTGAPGTDAEGAVAAALAAGPVPGDTLRPPVGSVTADAFELFRAVTGRRSGDQVRRFDWSVDPEPWVAVFGTWPFTLRAADLVE